VTGDHVVSRAELEACCQDVPFVKSLADIRVELKGNCGRIDWGGGGYLTDNSGDWLYAQRFLLSGLSVRVALIRRTILAMLLNYIAGLCQLFEVRCIAADGGGSAMCRIAY